MNIKNLFKKGLKREATADICIVVAIFIIFFTTLALNIYVAMYLLAAILLIISYILARR